VRRLADAIQELCAQAKDALANFDDWSIHHVKHAENADADRLVNEALDNR
jgi:ribonuclease HI